MDKQAIASVLLESAEEHGFLSVLSFFLPDIRVRLPLPAKLWDTPVEEYDFTVRSRNGLMRANVKTVGDCVELIMSDGGLEGVRNLGRISISEIKTKILTLAYHTLNDREKWEFWLYVVNNYGGNEYAI